MSKTVPTQGANLDAMLDVVVETHDEIVLTRDGKPVARLVAIDADVMRSPMAGTVLYEGDIISPVDEE